MNFKSILNLPVLTSAAFYRRKVMDYMYIFRAYLWLLSSFIRRVVFLMLSSCPVASVVHRFFLLNITCIINSIVYRRRYHGYGMLHINTVIELGSGYWSNIRMGCFKTLDKLLSTSKSHIIGQLFKAIKKKGQRWKC